jgi:quinohemoprotein amine dehydrogenase
MRRTVHNRTSPRALALAAGLITQLAAAGAYAAPPAAEALVNTKCAACHTAKGDGKWDRISDSRRTPEGWDMTVARMGFAHGVKLSHDERSAIVKYLSDAYGLSPDETVAHRYIIERQPSVVEHHDNKVIGDTCARCHSYARVAVQRRTEDDWRKLAHFHVGQFPTVEIQAGGRDRNWFELATGDAAVALGKVYGYDSASWAKWKAQKPVDMSGTWRLVGHKPGTGAYEGSATIQRTGDDRYSVAMELRYENGATESATGSSIVYTGHEWRATVQQGGKNVHQVFSLQPGGAVLTGRWFEEDNDAVGGDLKAVRAGSAATVLSVQPAMLRSGSRASVTINGTGLEGDVDLGPGVKVQRIVARSAERVTLEVDVAAGAAIGARTVSVGKAQGADALKVFKRIDYVKITPDHPMARVGGAGGSTPKVPAQLEAIAYSAGADGKTGTADDLRLGAVDASWSLANLNKAAEEMRDVEYAGRIEKNGLFVTNDAGPNPDRKYGANNVGELRVTATVKDGGRTVKATAPLIVTVQRWNDPPIR